MSYLKEDQLKKVNRVNLNKLSKIENDLLHDTIKDRSNGICQLCNERQGVDFHHAEWGCYGADRNDSLQLLCCRTCHELCHREKHGALNKMARKIAATNWDEHADMLVEG